MKINKLIPYRPVLNIIPILLFLTAGCHRPVAEDFKSEIDSIAVQWAPDIREAIFDAKLISVGPDMILQGETDIPQAKEALTGLLKNKGIIFLDSLKVLPDTTIIKEAWGLVNVSVCNIRAASSYGSELVTQALMGTPVKILKKDGGWFMIQTPDLYLGWVDSDAIETMNPDEYKVWESAPRIFYLKKTGDVFAEPSSGKVISDIVAGCIIELTGDQEAFFEVRLPDERKGFINKNEGVLLDELTAETYLTPENLVSTAESFMGIPYLWGGTSAKGFDCSGFVKTVYFLNGIILSRDASQQFRNGLRIRRSSYPDSCKAGDLLFFGSTRYGRPRATHVGMYLGNSEFIHAAGMVKVNSLDSTRHNFSRYRRDTFLGVRRIIGAEPGTGVQLVSDHKWYH
ncbi:MAG: C40 family peptidase [Bacteroidota bacterium]